MYILFLAMFLQAAPPKPLPPKVTPRVVVVSSVVAVPESPTVVTISWTDSNPAGTTYNVHRAIGPCTSATAYGEIWSNEGSKTWSDATVVAGNTYCYYIVAKSSGVLSSPSPKAQAVVPTSTTPQHSVTLNWVDTVNPSGTKYAVHRGDGPCATGQVLYRIATELTSKSYLDSTVVTTAKYCYYVIAYSSTGDSAPSNQVSVTIPTDVVPPTVPSAVTNLTVIVK